MMIVERDTIYLAKLPKSVGLVSRIAPPHSGARAELRESEAPRDPIEFVGHETVVEADVMGDENAVPHELHETVGYLREQGCVPNHFVRDAGQLNDLCGKGRGFALSIQPMPGQRTRTPFFRKAMTKRCSAAQENRTTRRRRTERAV